MSPAATYASPRRRWTPLAAAAARGWTTSAGPRSGAGPGPAGPRGLVTTAGDPPAASPERGRGRRPRADVHRGAAARYRRTGAGGSQAAGARGGGPAAAGGVGDLGGAPHRPGTARLV